MMNIAVLWNSFSMEYAQNTQCKNCSEHNLNTCRIYIAKIHSGMNSSFIKSIAVTEVVPNVDGWSIYLALALIFLRFRFSLKKEKPTYQL